MNRTEEDDEKERQFYEDALKNKERLIWLITASDAGGGIFTRGDKWIARLSGAGKEFQAEDPYTAIDKAVSGSKRPQKPV